MGAKIQNNVFEGDQVLLGADPSDKKHGVRHGDKRLRYSGTASIVAVSLFNGAVPADLDFLTVPSSKYLPYKFGVFNPSANHAAATLGLYTQPGGAGTAIVAPTLLSTLTAVGKFQILTIAALTDLITDMTLYPRLTVSSANAGTADLVLWYHDLSSIEDDA